MRLAPGRLGATLVGLVIGTFLIAAGISAAWYSWTAFGFSFAGETAMAIGVVAIIVGIYIAWRV